MAGISTAISDTEGSLEIKAMYSRAQQKKEPQVCDTMNAKTEKKSLALFHLKGKSTSILFKLLLFRIFCFLQLNIILTKMRNYYSLFNFSTG